MTHIKEWKHPELKEGEIFLINVGTNKNLESPVFVQR